MMQLAKVKSHPKPVIHTTVEEMRTILYRVLLRLTIHLLCTHNFYFSGQKDNRNQSKPFKVKRSQIIIKFFRSLDKNQKPSDKKSLFNL